jgi:hypothetical protein
MNKNIKKALVYLLNEEVIVTSWGISNINIEDTSIGFEVSGFIYQGKVQVSLYNDDGYKINFDTGESVICSIEELTKTLDSKIERTENYESCLREWMDCKE